MKRPNRSKKSKSDLSGLKLSRRTIRQLTEDQAKLVVGGSAPADNFDSN